MGDENGITDPEHIEDNKRTATQGWLADPPPDTPEPLPAHHVYKWRRMYGQLPPRGEETQPDY